MNDTTKFVGMDVSKEKIAVAVADGGSREPARYWGEIPHRIEYIRKLIGRLGEVEQLQVCYEAGPTGYMLERQLVSMGVVCVVAAPSLIPNSRGTGSRRTGGTRNGWLNCSGPESEHAPVIQALQAFRGIQEIAAAIIVAEAGSFLRFKNPRQLMAYSGVVPSEYSSGAEVRRGKITKTGNNHLRRIGIECAWSYRHPATMSAAIKKRQERLPPSIQAIAWKAQVRLCKKCRRLISRGKSAQVAVTAVARELLGFAWAVACEVENRGFKRFRGLFTPEELTEAESRILKYSPSFFEEHRQQYVKYWEEKARRG